MDKLELDARVAKLERAVSRLRTVNCAAIPLMMLAVFFGLLMLLRLITPAENIPDAISLIMISVPEIDVKIRELSDLESRGIISDREIQATKEQLLSGHLMIRDTKADLGIVEKLRFEGMLTDTEYVRLRRRILQPRDCEPDPIH